VRSERRILIVDDDDAIRTLLATVIRRRGFRADVARDGVDAVAALAARRYALVLLDLMMPLMNGYDVLQHIATLAAGARPLVLVLTAGIEPRPIDASLVIGILHKPFDVELLIDTIGGCMSSLDSGSHAVPAAAASQQDERPN